MNQTIRRYVDAFAASNYLRKAPDSEKFEAWSAFVILRKYHDVADDLNVTNGIVTGGPRDGGIDAAAILFNKNPVLTIDDVNRYEKLRSMSSDLVMMQAKTSESFNSTEMNHFFTNVKMFCQNLIDEKTDSYEDEVLQVMTLAIHADKVCWLSYAPKLSVYFVTCGRWSRDNRNLAESVEQAHKELTDLRLFSEVKITPIDESDLRAAHRDLSQRITRRVSFAGVPPAIFPDIPAVNTAVIGLLQAREFVRLVSTDSGDLNRSLFYENIRDYLGSGNKVNSEIANTLSSPNKRVNFPLLNNGVTIIAGKIVQRANWFTLEDYQIVNGCQTTNVVFENKDNIDEETYIPVKIVETDNSQLVAEMIAATNNQTVVEEIAFLSLNTFQRELEEHYDAQREGGGHRGSLPLPYYERRYGQHRHSGVDRARVVRLGDQVRSFVSMFLNRPDLHGNGVGTLLEGRVSIFDNNHRKEPYYASGFATCAVREWLSKKEDGKNILPVFYANKRKTFERFVGWYQWHLIMILRTLICGEGSMPDLASKDMIRYAGEVISALKDSSLREAKLDEAASILKKAVDDFAATGGANGGSAKYFKSSVKFTQFLIERTSGDSTHRAADVESGTIQWYRDGQGVIERDCGGTLRVFRNEVKDVPPDQRRERTRVCYTVEGEKACEVKLE